MYTFATNVVETAILSFRDSTLEMLLSQMMDLRWYDLILLGLSDCSVVLEGEAGDAVVL